MKMGQEHLAPYGSYKSRHDFTQRQLMSCLILKVYLKTTYRGVIDWLSGHKALREILGLEEKLPHYTALQKFSARPGAGEAAEAMIARIGLAGLRREGKKAAIAIDSTGFEPSGASPYYISRTGRKCNRFRKLSVSVVCGCILPLGIVLDWGPSNDKKQAPELLTKSFQHAGEHMPASLLGDAGFDADWVHGVCREVWAVKSWIKPVIQRKDGTIGGYYRPLMTDKALKTNRYGKRWHVESFFSGLKRLCGSTLNARLDLCQRNEIIFKVLAYALHR